jgi:hypothetical protein
MAAKPNARTGRVREQTRGNREILFDAQGLAIGVGALK